MDTQEKYTQYLEKKEQEWENRCIRCGACCGAYEDPCEHLRKDEQGYYCPIYKDRFGLRKTVNGEEFYCVPVKEILSESWPGSYRCAYKKKAHYYARSRK
ncbi:MAG: hypothetical protein JXD21_04425 [Candidatus Omnitrophica bacterium]|nr:hypothetical protein [Candidatus Omnitrophota bacterium]